MCKKVQVIPIAIHYVIPMEHFLSKFAPVTGRISVTAHAIVLKLGQIVLAI